MDLPYPSRPNLDQSPIHRLDKRMRSTIWSVKEITKADQNLSSSLRERLVKIISKDRVGHLSKKIASSHVSLEAEIGSKGSRWTLLHYCARWNATACLQYILRLQYKTDQEEYFLLVNSKTVEGDTPLMIAILYGSRQAIQTLLEYGGSDIFLINNSKLTAYQLAVSNNNESAIKLLIDYEMANKQKTFINIDKLKLPYQLPKEPDKCCCFAALRCFIQWAFRSPKDQQLFEKNRDRDSLTSARDSVAERPSIQLRNLFFDPNFPRIASSICQDTQLLKEYQIEWIRAEELYSSFNIELYDNFNAFETKQLNFTLKHQLTIFQSLARQPWIVKKMFKQPAQKGAYDLELFPNGLSQRITIDDFIPCLKDKKEPLFLMNSRELWPMLLQKAWVKTYGYYIKTQTVPPKRMLEQLTGFPTETFQITEFKDQLFESLKQISKNGSIVILTTKADSRLQQQGQGSDSFSILSFYQKDSKKLYLVNCPFLIPKWKERDRNEPLGLRLIKAHYNNHNQMSLWFDDEKIRELFQTITICYIKQNYQRSERKAVGKAFVFFKFEIKGEGQFQFVLKLHEFLSGEIKGLPTRSIEIGHNNSLTCRFAKKHPESLDRLTCLKLIEGQYLCKIELQNPEDEKQLILVMHGPQKISIRSLDELLGKVQWLELLKESILHSKDFKQMGEGIEVCWEKFDNYYLVVLKCKNNRKNKERYFIELEQFVIEQVLQGTKESASKVGFEKIDQRQFFSIFTVKQGRSLEELGVRFVSR